MTAVRHLDRRRAIATITAGLIGGVAGCSWGQSFPDADVIAGPEGRNVFEPAELTVPVGEPVTWGFGSSGHNVSCRPEDGDDVVLPDEAEPFASYAPEESPGRSYVPQGETFEHDFDAVGRYVYVCVPHADRGMVGTIRVE